MFLQGLIWKHIHVWFYRLVNDYVIKEGNRGLGAFHLEYVI